MSFAILALVMGSGNTALKGGEAIKQLTDFETQYRADAKASGKPLQVTEYRAAIKQKAESLLEGVDVAAIPPTDSLDWVKVLDAADRRQDSVIVLDHFLASKPAPADAFKAKMSETTEFRMLKQNDKAQDILVRTKPSNEDEAKQLAAQDSMLARTLEPAAGLKFLDRAGRNFKGYDLELKTLTSAKASIMMPTTREKLVGTKAPEFKVMDEKYGTFTDLKSLKGKVVILDYFAHWCPPCKASMPDMRQLTDDLGEKVQVVGVTAYYGYFGAKRGIDQKEEFADMKGFMDEYKIDHPVVYIDKSEFADYGVSGIPEFVLIGKDGKVKKIQLGYSADSFKEFRKAVEAETSK